MIIPTILEDGLKRKATQAPIISGTPDTMPQKAASTAVSQSPSGPNANKGLRNIFPFRPPQETR
jgi:hypothetical protein